MNDWKNATKHLQKFLEYSAEETTLAYRPFAGNALTLEEIHALSVSFGSCLLGT